MSNVNKSALTTTENHIMDAGEGAKITTQKNLANKENHLD